MSLLRRSLFVAVGLALPCAALAQKNAPAISAATVARVVNTLAADSMQGRAAGTPGSAKAARFLAAEFQRAGLQPLPGNAGFEQSFEAWRTRTLTAQATVGGVPVAPARLLVIPGQETLTWSSTAANAPRVVIVGPKDDPWKAFWPARKPTGVSSPKWPAWPRTTACAPRNPNSPPPSR